VLKSEISDKYIGKCKNGLAHGRGIAEGKDKYEGHFKYGLPDGKGKYTWSTGEVYEGFWKEGMRSGEGKYKYKKDGADSMRYGIWKEDLFVKKIEPRPYQVTISRDIDRYSIRKMGNDDMITLSLERVGGVDSDVSELSYVSDNGLYREENRNYIYYQLRFPVTIKIRYTSTNKLKTFVTHPAFEVVITEPGSWMITLYN